MKSTVSFLAVQLGALNLQILNFGYVGSGKTLDKHKLLYAVYDCVTVLWS